MQTQKYVMLPNFLVAGAAKSATTSLYNYLRQHPEVYMSPTKEPHFFSFVGQSPSFSGPGDEKVNEKIFTDLHRYEGLFEEAQGAKAIGECSPSYLYFPEAAANIKKYIPDCKIAIVLRDPIERTYSHYLMHVMLGFEALSFEKALEAEKERLQRNWRWSFDYTGQSMYYEKVRQYYDVFGRAQVQVHLFEDVAAQTADVMKSICMFLNIDASFYEEFNFKVHNPSGKEGMLHQFIREPNLLKKITKPFTSRSLRRKIRKKLRWYADASNAYKEKPEMNPGTRARLQVMFREDCLRLQELIQRDLSHWQPLSEASHAKTTSADR